MKSKLFFAPLIGMALMWPTTGKTVALDIAQVPLASCLTDTEYRSASALAVDPVNKVVYQAKYKASDWSGQLLAYQIDSSGSLDKNKDGAVNVSDALWEAGQLLNSDTARHPYSFVFPDSSCLADGTCPKSELAGTYFDLTGSWTLSVYQSNTLVPSGTVGFAVEDSVRYWLGDRVREKPNGTNPIFRHRDVLLGDLINSDPLFVGSEDFNYSSLPGDEGSKYQAFQSQKSQVVAGKTPRSRMVYVGGNDGMLHGFEAGTWDASKPTGFNTGTGNEIFTFTPGTIINGHITDRAFDSLTDTSKNFHAYMVDGSPKAGDAYFNGAWHTVLLGTTGASPTTKVWGVSDLTDWGGRSVFALDVTEPGDFKVPTTGSGKVLWEFTDNAFILDKWNIGADADLGVTLSQPSLARMQNGKWAAIVGNGYNSKNQKPVLYILDISLKPTDQKFIMAKISPCNANDSLCPNNLNGLSTPIAVDVDFDRKVDYIYAGDLQGNVWKFDVNCPKRNSVTGDDANCQINSSGKDWKVSNDGKPLFVACASASTSCAPEDRQPITAKPNIGSVSAEQANAVFATNGSKPSVMVYFGTGKFLGVSDREIGSSQQQTFYALWDANTGTATTNNSIDGRSKLKQQIIVSDPITKTFTDQNGATTTLTFTNLRVTSKEAPCYKSSCATQHKGWFLDLTKPTGSPSERSVGFPLLLNGNVVFTSFIPSPDPCVSPLISLSWAMELDAITGTRPSNSPFDLFGTGAQGGQPDGTVNTLDLVTVGTDNKVAPSGIQSTVGILKTPALVYGKEKVDKYFGGTTGATQMVTDPGESLGRVSWRQLR